MRGLIHDETAVSMSVGFILTFTVTIICMSVLIGSFFTMLNRAEQTAIRDEFEIHGNEIALQIANMDTMVHIMQTSGGQSRFIVYKLIMPDKIADKQYSVEISNQTSEIIFESEGRYKTRVKVPYVALNTNVASGIVYSSSDNFRLCYDGESNIIRID
jgi:hypothetical protein